jgi:hypothetical protein
MCAGGISIPHCFKLERRASDGSVWLYSRHFSGDKSPVGYDHDKANRFDDNNEPDYARTNKFWLSRIKIIEQNVEINGNLIYKMLINFT